MTTPSNDPGAGGQGPFMTLKSERSDLGVSKRQHKCC